MFSLDRFLKACRCEKTDRPPVWLMRQAGRHLPEYQALRDKHPFLDLLTNEELIVEVSLQPWRRYGVDGVIVFSDILLLPKAMGMNLMFIEGQGPKFEKLIETPADLEKLKSLESKKDIPFLMKALKKIKKEIGDKAALIGFAGAPWTVASYMVQESPSKKLLDRLTQETILYLKAQIEAGVDVIQIFDSWGGSLTPEEYPLWSGKYIKEIIKALKPPHPHPPPQGGREKHLSPSPLVGEGWGEGVPIVLYIKDSKHLLSQMLDTGADVISVGWETSLEAAKEVTKGKRAIQGNLNPHILMQSTPDEIRKQTRNILETMKETPGYIANLGHGVLPKTPVENVEAFVDTVRKSVLSTRYSVLGTKT